MPITIERVLVATDFSKAGQRAVDVAAEWARQTHAQLRIVHVTPTKGWLSSAWGITSSVAEVIQSHAASALKQVAESADPSRPLELSTGVLSGPAARSIVRAAREYHAHLLVVGARGERDADGEPVLGGTSAKLLETAETPLLLVRQARKDPVAGVVAAVDLSPHSRAVLEWADFASAERHCLSITSTTCRSRRGSRHMAYLRLPSMSYSAQARSQCEADLTALVTSIGRGGVTSTAVDRGDPAFLLRQYIGSVRPSLVVLGKHVRRKRSSPRSSVGSVCRFIAGSVSSDVLVV